MLIPLTPPEAEGNDAVKSTYVVAVVTCALIAGACTQSENVNSSRAAVSQGVKSQLRGYDLGPPFPAGLRDSGLINGYAEGDWIPFVAAIDGKKLSVSDGLAGGTGDGRFGATLIFPTYSLRHDANGISDFAVTGTYGQGSVTPIPSPFDDGWLVANGYSPFELGAWDGDTLVDSAPVVTSIYQRSGPTRFGGQVSSVAVSVEFNAPADATRIEVRFAVRLAPPDLQAIAPGAGSFPGTAAGTAKGAASFHPGPGPIFVGYQVGDPTGIATVPIRVDHDQCEGDQDCPPGDYCDGGGECQNPCVDDASCPTDEICEDGVCQPPPPPCTTDEDCNGNDTCEGGYCVPPCDDTCADPEFCDKDPCVPPDGTPPCITDAQCQGGDVCEDGVCQPPEPPCDMSCPGDDVCLGNQCVPPGNPCTDDGDCPGGDVCVDGVCQPGTPPCTGSDCGPCTYDADCPGGFGCEGGFCVPVQPPPPCTTASDCPSGDTCDGGYCTPPPPPCGPAGECGPGEFCETETGTCQPEHPPVPCTDVSDCPSGDYCTGGFCDPNPPGGPCKNNNQCGGDDVCNNGTCEPPQTPCTDDSQCSGGVCLGGFCEPPHPPIACTDPTDCPSGDECTGGFCQPPDSCSVNDDCPGGELCESGHCHPGQPPVPCTVDQDCPPPGDDVYVNTCYGGFCTPSTGGCTDATDCAGGEVCANGVCVPGDPPAQCANDYDCPGGYTCENGVCQPGGVVDGCTTAADCPANGTDDVGPACVGGLCTSNRIAPTSCAAGETCAPGTSCSGGVCLPIAGACELDSDCSDGSSCVAGWCGVACASGSECTTGVCSLGRCADPCGDYSQCGNYEACLSGGCVPLAAAVGQVGGDQSSWEPDVPGSDSNDVKGGCNSGGGGAGGTLLLVLCAFGLIRRRRPSAAAIAATLALVAGAALGCSSNDPAGDTGGSPDANNNVTPPGADAATPSGDGGADNAPYHMVTCEGGPTDAGADWADAGPTDGDAGTFPPSLGNPCCSPDGVCPGALACIEDPDGARSCQPFCTTDADCPDGDRCADFAGTGACIPGSTEGQDCAPEQCDQTTICVGSNADNALCRRRCTDTSDCADGDTCTMLNGTDSMACLPPSY